MLRAAVSITANLYESLRTGDLATVKLAQPKQVELAAALSAASNRREAAAARLARTLGLPAENLTLSRLAASLGSEQAAALREARDRLTAIATELGKFQQRNANLVHHLRSYFRNVLSALTNAADVPVRYGASGARLNPGFGAAIQARG